MNELQIKYNKLWLQVVLIVFLGPIGLFYSNKLFAIIFSIIFLPLILAFGVGIIFGWPASLVVGVLSVKDHNNYIYCVNSIIRK